MKTLTPFGISDWLPEKFNQFQSLITPLKKLFQQNNFKQIKTSSIEYLETLSPGIGENLKNQALKFLGPTGQMMTLRLDHTSAIARMVAQQQKKITSSLKYAYIDPVYRLPQETGFDDMELYQAGIEWIGNDKQADLTILKLAINALQKLKMKDIIFEINHVDILKTYTKKQIEALQENDYVKLGGIPHRGRLEKTKDSMPLSTLFNELKKEKLESVVQFNKGLTKPFEYYTGLIFKGYAKGSRQHLISGGRYDQLLGRFGQSSPAVGFSIQLNELARLKSC